MDGAMCRGTCLGLDLENKHDHGRHIPGRTAEVCVAIYSSHAVRHMASDSEQMEGGLFLPLPWSVACSRSPSNSLLLLHTLWFAK